MKCSTLFCEYFFTFIFNESDYFLIQLQEAWFRGQHAACRWPHSVTPFNMKTQYFMNGARLLSLPLKNFMEHPWLVLECSSNFIKLVYLCVNCVTTQQQLYVARSAIWSDQSCMFRYPIINAKVTWSFVCHWTEFMPLSTVWITLACSIPSSRFQSRLSCTNRHGGPKTGERRRKPIS